MIDVDQFRKDLYLASMSVVVLIEILTEAARGNGVVDVVCLPEMVGFIRLADRDSLMAAVSRLTAELGDEEAWQKLGDQLQAEQEGLS